MVLKWMREDGRRRMCGKTNEMEMGGSTPHHTTAVVLWFIRLVGRDGHGCGTCPGSLGTDDVRCDCDTMGTVTESSTPESMTECDCARGRSNPAQVH
ncbi:hypothetical protein LSTR_LSTR016679 [Laodelphax striatellus]|uniref:Uncharacterized protein n=1 Tax=Laodelphax striatellus TaxID=195883 RepID=A0A482XSW8_LAOST|nr:hypothetical protein LSTR_LSTR016679 [Laodelphax striatellus]